MGRVSLWWNEEGIIEQVRWSYAVCRWMKHSSEDYDIFGTKGDSMSTRYAHLCSSDCYLTCFTVCKHESILCNIWNREGNRVSHHVILRILQDCAWCVCGRGILIVYTCCLEAVELRQLWNKDIWLIRTLDQVPTSYKYVLLSPEIRRLRTPLVERRTVISFN